MKNWIKLPTIICLLCAFFTSIQKTQAQGTRTSLSNLVMVNNGTRTASITVKANEPFESGYPKWANNLAADGALTATYSGTSSQTVTIFLNGPCRLATIELVPEAKTTINIDSARFNDFKNKINTVLNSVSEVKNAVSLGGKIKGTVKTVDFYNDGSRVGNYYDLSGSISFGATALTPSTPAIPLGGIISVSFGGDISALSITATASGTYDESKAAKGSVSGTLSGGANVSVYAKAVAGLNAGDNAAGISLTGSVETNIGASGTISVDSSGAVKSSAEVGIGKVDMSITARFEITSKVDIQLAKGTKTIFNGITEKLPETTIYQISLKN